jgi:hypothetical protein
MSAAFPQTGSVSASPATHSRNQCRKGDEGTGDRLAVPASGEEPAEKKHLLLDELTDRLDTLRLFREDNEQRADAILEQFGARGKVESEMLDQMGARAPLAHPERFEEAHRTVMRALEVFDRNAARRPSGLHAGPLTPIASFVVQLLVRIIVRSYQSNVVQKIRELYGRREANSPRASPEFFMLGLARRQADRLAPDFKRKTAGFPAFLVGGAALSGVASALAQGAKSALHNKILLLIAAVVLAAIALAAFWCILTAAAIARRRTRIALDQPLRALWETIGAAGHPPRDQSRQFATYAAILLALAWIVVPVAVTYAVSWG